MGSCEYSNVQGERQTKILCVRNLRFFNKFNQDISHEYLALHKHAVIVAITFEFQKKEVCNDAISHQRSGDTIGNGEMCPVKAAIETVLRIVEYDLPPEKLKDNPINFVQFEGRVFTVPSSLIL
jgi:hypothetical protein